MDFRRDINGLRAIAVIAVVLYHFNPVWVPGGFAGVDVFFVISGFLMTGIIFRGLENRNFCVFEFYANRASRIIPALAFLCFVLLIFGWFYIIPPDYKAMGKHIYSSLGFFSNITYWKESGYFDSVSNEKWLLHTWSLSVEWQFYILYPIVLKTLNKLLSLNNVKRLIVVGAVLGFIFSIVATMRWPEPAYYLLPTRAWEMMVGGIAYLYPLKLFKRREKLTEFLGIILILVTYIFVSSNVQWPGYFSLLPVIGTYFVIVSNRKDSIFTSNIIFQYLGKWSYSIYLWHWPIVVYGYYFDVSSWYFYGVPISILLGFVSYKTIESYRLQSLKNFQDLCKAKYLYLSVAVAFSGYFVFINQPNEYIYPLPPSILSSIERKPYDCFDKNLLHEKDNVTCRLTDGERKILAIGDSHSYSSLPAVEEASKENGFALFYTGFSGCPPILNVLPIRSDQHLRNCKILNDKAVEFTLENDINLVFLAARWTYYTEGTYSRTKIQYLTLGEKIRNKQLSINSFKEGLEATLELYYKNDIDVILMLQVPMQESDPDKIYYKSLHFGELGTQLLERNSISYEKSKEFQLFTNDIIRSISSKYPNVTVFDPSLYLCNEDYCPVGTDKYSYYLDDDHLSIMGAKQLIVPIQHMLN